MRFIQARMLESAAHTEARTCGCVTQELCRWAGFVLRTRDQTAWKVVVLEGAEGWGRPTENRTNHVGSWGLTKAAETS